MSRKIIIGKELEVKKGLDNISKEAFIDKNQIPMVNQLYLNQEFKGKAELIKSLKQKMSSYKSQDTKKNKINNNFITYDELLEKLVISKLKCHYCRKDTLIMYENKREPLQWTLDRIDNDMGHSSENTVICCLKCNLDRRCLNDKKFKFTKQMRLIKKK
jgi:hypothetical protein